MNKATKCGIVLGLGVDIVKVSRFRKLIESRGGVGNSFTERFARRILHPKKELIVFQQLGKRKNITEVVHLLAGAWATKEATFKTLDPIYQKGFVFCDWYRFYDSSGKPRVGCENYNLKDEEFLLSISHDGGILIGTVLRQKVIN